MKFYCDCRKPKIGMLIKAAEEHNIDLRNSWYIGDTTLDIQTSINAGMHTILLLTGKAENISKYNVKADFVAEDLVTAVKYVLGSLNE